MSLALRPEDLQEIALFAGLGPAALEALARQTEVVEVEPGDVVCEEGTPGRELWFVLVGELECRCGVSSGHEWRLGILGPGNWFGDMALLDLQGQPASVRALAPGRLGRLSAHALDGLYRRDIKSYALLWMNAARELSRRLRCAQVASPRPVAATPARS